MSKCDGMILCLVALQNAYKIKTALNHGDFTNDHSQNLSANQCKEIGLNIKFLEENKLMNN